jgi:hypothetical protein
MTIDKKYFLDRLANGENIDDIGKEIADMMNAAVADYDAEQAQAEKEIAKRDLVEEMLEIMAELAILEGFDAEEFTYSPEEVDNVVAGISEMFAAMRELKALLGDATSSAPSSDEDVLGNFIKMFI